MNWKIEEDGGKWCKEEKVEDKNLKKVIKKTM